MNPAFAPAHMRNLVPVFFKHANHLHDILGELVRTSATDRSAWKDEAQRAAYEGARKDGDEETVQDVMKWMNRVTLDIIGEGASSSHSSPSTRRCGSSSLSPQC